MMGGSYAGFWWMGLHWIVWLLLIVVVVWMVVALVGRLRHGGDAGPAVGASTGGGDAVAILDARYARGEIEREEYLRRKRDLG